MIKLIFSAIFMYVISASAWAVQYEYSYNQTQWLGDPQSACQAWFNSFSADNKAYYGGGVKTMTNESSCYTKSNGQYTTISKRIAAITCTKDSTSYFGVTYASADSAAVSPLPAADLKGCAVTPMGMKVTQCSTSLVNGSVTCNFSAMETGGVPGGIPPNLVDSSKPAPGDVNRVDVPPLASGTGVCPAGTTSGGVDSGGVTICMGRGTDAKASPVAPTQKVSAPVITSNADGSVSSVTTTTTNNGDGSLTIVTNTTVTGQDGSKTQSQTSSTGDAPSGKPGQFTDPNKDTDFCVRNPSLSVCRNSSVTGSCGQIACTGDAIQCATLRAASAMECKQRADDDLLKASPLTSLGGAAVSGNDPLKSSLPSVSNASVVNAPSSLDASGWLGGGSAFVDKSFTVQNKTITIPLSKWSSYMLAFRYALMAIAALVSFRIISGAVLT